MLAVVTAFLAAVVVFSALRARETQVRKLLADQVNVVVAARDIPIGSRLVPGMLRLAPWPSNSVPDGAFTSTAALANSYARVEFLEGEPIVKKRIFAGDTAGAVMPLLIPRGMRAMSVPVDAVSDIAGFVKPRTRVDVLVAIAGNGSGINPFSKVVLQDVQVLAVAQEIGPGKDEPKVVRVVTLLVTPHQAEKLTLASREGTLRLAMRNYSDTEIVATSGSDIRDLLGRPERSSVMVSQAASATPGGKPSSVHRGRRGYSIEIMRDGRKTETVSFVNQGMPEVHAAAMGSRERGSDAKMAANGRSATAMAPAAAMAGTAPTAGFVSAPVPVKTIEIP
jgi:pilus assembly protein CpaB